MRIEITGGTAAIYANHNDRPAVIARLLEAAGPGRTGVVRTVTGGNTLALSVPVEIARAAGLLPEGVDTSEMATAPSETQPGENEQAKPEPKPAGKPRATRKAADNAE